MVLRSLPYYKYKSLAKTKGNMMNGSVIQSMELNIFQCKSTISMIFQVILYAEACRHVEMYQLELKVTKNIKRRNYFLKKYQRVNSLQQLSNCRICGSNGMRPFIFLSWTVSIESWSLGNEDHYTWLHQIIASLY